MKRMLALFLLLALLLTLCGCGKDQEASILSTGETVEGYVPSEIPYPDWFQSYSPCFAWENGVLYIGGKDGSTICIAAYDTLSDSWSRYDFDNSGLLEYASLSSFSVADGSLWALVWNNGMTQPEYDYYLLRGTVDKPELTRIPITFEAEHNTESSSLVFSGVFALDAERAVVFDYSNGYLIDSGGALQRTLEGEYNFASWSKAKGQSYLGYWGGDGDGCRLLDPSSLSFGPVLPVSVSVNYASDAGRFLCCDEANGRSLCSFDPESGAVSKLFDWMDVAVDTASMGGYHAFENEKGEIYYPGGPGLIRVTKGMIPLKESLVLAAPYRANQYMDTILYFNNTDPEYKIEIQDMQRGDSADYDRQLIELATAGGVDLIDTTLLPDTALDGGVLTDLLPFIDADPELGREDFIQPLLQAMLRNGGLYQLQPKFTMMSFATHESMFPGRDAWTIDYVNQLIAEHPETPVFFWHRNQAVLTDMLIKMSTAEFVDYDTATCHFDDPRFAQWLQFVKDLPYAAGVEDYVDGPVLLHPENDVAGDIGFFCRSFLRDENYVNCGFPSTEGNGSYFVSLGVCNNDEAGTQAMGAFRQLGILASSPHKEAAWRFVRLLLTRMDHDEIMTGIPVLKSSFESLLTRSISAEQNASYQASMGTDWFNEDDAAKLRELVYGTEKMVHGDQALLDILRGAINAYLEGHYSLDGTVELIQSRSSLYVSEQYG